MKQYFFDIAIIGGGPAGATLARLLGDCFRVAIIDKRNLEEHSGRTTTIAASEKCCGGLVAPDAQAALAQMGLGLPRHVLAGPQLFMVKSIDLQTGLERFYHRHYININRPDFDRWLFSMINDCVHCFTESLVISIKSCDPGFSILFRHAGITREINAETVIGADGARSIVRRLLYPGKKPSRIYYAMQEWFKVQESQPYFSAIFDPEITDYYAWTIPKDDCLILGAALEIRNKPLDKMKLLRKKLEARGMVFGKMIRRKASFLQRPASGHDVFFGRDNAFLIGEAAGFVSPSSGEGLSYAMRSAMHLADRMLNRRSSRDCFYGWGFPKQSRMKRIIAGKCFKSAVIFNPFIRNIIMRTGAGSLKMKLGNKTRKGFCNKEKQAIVPLA
ncbi:MAG: FAD-binding protein [Spirochaetaceae bacterium]|nr:MAG: FAD-binding protein [Spirochaetaceae bacterium]